ncbi:chemotaxis protein MotB [Marinobacter daqiaonensis]|uniref:Chemotaxis protein MotB n=1 Tax=Marinobacter daqiaonensis TaxID=650891 RepID=A0A1I6GHN3_9GAMM|nr:peptidoglycan -binding protein [Marinobacter daqiaonensis]SFR41670.1 chemotaxis protein MotB [Marinobacter daqiaonensis]
MIGYRRRNRSAINIWPGFVDALSALLMLVIFMLLVYVVSQLYLSQTLSDRETQLARLNSQLDEISSLLGLERDRTEALEQEMQRVQNQLGASLDLTDELEADLEQAREEARSTQNEIDAQRLLIGDLEATAEQAEQALSEEQLLSAAQRAMLQQLSDRIGALQSQLRQISEALRLQKSLTAEKEAELAEVGRRLNTLLAERVSKLEQYQSEFFGRLREILRDNENIRVVGDRFLLPSELLFASASDELGPAGQRELDKLARVLLDVARRIPEDIDWILRIDGHTDRIPINTPEFPSNWELSTARAVSVVRYLASQGVPEDRMAAAGFGEHFPVAEGLSEEALRKNRRIEIKLTSR